MKKKLLITSFVIYLIIILIATKALLDRNDYGAFETKNSYFICNEKIKEYDKSSLVHFDKNTDYEKMVEEDIYYFDKNSELQIGKLTSFNKESEIISVNELAIEKEKVLGRPDKAYQLIGSLLNILTSRAFYLIFVIIPIIGLFICEIYMFVKYLSHEKNGKELDDDKEIKKKS